MKSKRIMAGILGFSLVLAGCGINSAQTDVTPKDTTEQLAKAETSEEKISQRRLPKYKQSRRQRRRWSRWCRR